MYIYILRERGKKRVAGKETPLIYKSNGPGIKPGREASLRHYNPDRFDLYLTLPLKPSREMNKVFIFL